MSGDAGTFWALWSSIIFRGLIGTSILNSSRHKTRRTPKCGQIWENRVRSHSWSGKSIFEICDCTEEFFCRCSSFFAYIVPSWFIALKAGEVSCFAQSTHLIWSSNFFQSSFNSRWRPDNCEKDPLSKRTTVPSRPKNGPWDQMATNIHQLPSRIVLRWKRQLHTVMSRRQFQRRTELTTPRRSPWKWPETMQVDYIGDIK